MQDPEPPGPQSPSLARARAAGRAYHSYLAGEVAYRRWAWSVEGRANASRLRALRGRFVGRRAVVMGNGPSLLRSDLNRLADDVTIVSNAHYLIWDQLTYIPTILTVEDRLVAEDRAEELNGLEGILRIFPFDLRGTLGPAGATKLYVNFPRIHRASPRFSYDIAKRAYWGGTVSYLNLQIAAYLGCGPIALVGFDHSYVVPARAAADPVIRSEEVDVNHIHPDYFGPGYRWHDPNVERMEAAYRSALAALSATGVSVVNATEGGHLEVFPRMRFDDMVSAS